MKSHIITVRMVRGMAMTQYIQIFSDTAHGWLPLLGEKLKKLMLNMVCSKFSMSPYVFYALKLTEVKVAGKNTIVTTAIVFIAALSILVALLISFMTLLSL